MKGVCLGASAAGRGVLALALVVVASSGCRLGPDYSRPAVEVPGQWRWKPAQPRDEAPRGPWWSVYGEEELDRLEEEVAVSNLGLQAALARVEQARAVARVRRSEWYPTLTASGSFGRSRTSGNSPSPVGFPIPSVDLEQWQTPLDLSYEIDLWGRVRRSFESARQSLVGAEAARQALLLSLQAEVAEAYFGVQSLDRELGLLDRTVVIRREALAIFEQRAKAGMLAEFEVQRGLVEVASAEADLEATRRLRVIEWNRLAVLCGKPPAAFEARVSSNLVALPAPSPGLPAALLERRPDVAEAERTLAARMAQIGVARAAFFPSVRLTASGGFLSGEVSDLFQWDSHVWSIGPSVSVPVFAGGRNRAGVEQARAAYEEAVANYRQQVLVAFREVEDSLASSQFLSRELEARRVASEAATAAARQAFARYQAGAVNFLDVVDAEQARLRSLLAEERTRRQQYTESVRLQKALGGGWFDPSPPAAN